MTAKQKNRPILVPVDFSPHSEAALVCAAELAESLGSALILLHVVHDPGEAPGYYSVKGRGKQLRRMEDVATEMLDDFFLKMQKKHSGLSALKDATTMLVVGLPVNRILESAEKVDARMIVMASQGRTGLAHILLGSKAEQIVRLAPLPVMIVKDRKNGKDGKNGKNGKKQKS
jgi:nucleotide-binding universal stress UspA family protein